MIHEYSLRLDGSAKLTENFKVGEFACADGSDVIKISTELVTLLQQIRDEFKTPVTIRSAYRTVKHNAAVGGAAGSRHVLGDAADIVAKGVTPLAICQYVEWLRPNRYGVGLYPSHAHVDTRPSRSRWDSRSGLNVIVSGFPGWLAPDRPAASTPDDNVPIIVKCPCGGDLGLAKGRNIKGTVYAPLRAICVALGHPVDWDGKQVTVRWK